MRNKRGFPSSCMCAGGGWRLSRRGVVCYGLFARFALCMGYVSMRSKINSRFSFASRNLGSVSVSHLLGILVLSNGTKNIYVGSLVAAGVPQDPRSFEGT